MNFVREKFYYKDGNLFNRKSGKLAGCKRKPPDRNYYRVRIGLKGKTYPRSHLIWYYHYDKFPTKHLYRLNDDMLDDRIENLAEMDMKEIARFRKPAGQIPFLFVTRLKVKRGNKLHYYYRFEYKYKLIKYTTDLKTMIKFRNDWLMKNAPEDWDRVKMVEPHINMDEHLFIKIKTWRNQFLFVFYFNGKRILNGETLNKVLDKRDEWLMLNKPQLFETLKQELTRR